MNQWVEYEMGRRLEGMREHGDEVWRTPARRHSVPSLDDLIQSRRLSELSATASEADEPSIADLIQPELVRQAQNFFSTFGLQIGAALLYRSLPECYAAGRGAQVLYLTGELVSSPERRIRETMQFLLDVMSPDPSIVDSGLRQKTTLHPGHRAARVARGMRVFHESVRCFISEGGRWEGRKKYFEQLDPRGPVLGEPLNQEDLLGTLLEFTAGVFESLEKLGVPYTPDDKVAWFHVWNIVSRYMGIGTESAFRGKSSIELAPEVAGFLPLDPTYAHETLAVIRRRHFVASFEGKLLTNALLGMLQHPLSRGLKPLPASLMRYLLGSETADLLGITRGGWFQEWLISAETLPRVASAVTSGRLGGPVRATTGELSSFMTYQLLQSYVDDQTSARPFNLPRTLRRSRGLNRLTSLQRVPSDELWVGAVE